VTEFEITYKANVIRIVSIQAETLDEAVKIFHDGEFGPWDEKEVDIKDVQIIQSQKVEVK